MDEFDVEIAPIVATPVEASRNTPFAERLGRRGRALRAGVITGTLLLALAIVVAVTPGAPTAIAGLVLGPTATATATLVAGQDLVAFEDPVPWGTLTIDGRPGPKILSAQAGTPTSAPDLHTFRLARGRHQVEYRADLFPTLRCTISVPLALKDTCPLGKHGEEFPTPAGTYTRLIDLGETPDRLPATAATQLLQATQRALDLVASTATGTLGAGDHYLDDRGRVIVAGEALHTNPTFTLFSTDGAASNNGDSSYVCAGLCATLSPLAQASADDWLLYGQMEVAWHYADVAGHLVLADGLATSPTVSPFTTVGLGVRRVDGDWQVQVQPPAAPPQDPPLCFVGAAALESLRDNPDQTTLYPPDSSFQWRESSLPDLGCVFGGGQTDDAGNLTGAVALVLYRCGVLLAVNDAATRVFPHLTVASPPERALAFAAWPPIVSAAAPVG